MPMSPPPTRSRPMPDTTARNPGFPRDWSDAFNALPLEAPPRDAWSRLAPHLGTRRRPRHLPAWLGLAAAAAAVVAVIAWPRTPSLVGATQVATAPSLVGATQVATEDPPMQEDLVEPSKALAASAAPTREIPASSNQPSMARLSEPQQASARLQELQQESARLEA